MTAFVLVHGAWHGAWCWEKIIPPLEAAGKKIYAPDLPGHGNDKTPIHKIKWPAYVRSISELIVTIKEPVILVGHSMAGMIISQVAEKFSNKIKKLIYIAAFLPKNRESMMSIAQRFPPSRFSQMMKADMAANTFDFPWEYAKEFAYHQCQDEIVATILPRLTPEPLHPLMAAVSLSMENFGRVEKVYIECKDDKAILPANQNLMAKQAQCGIVSMLTDHSPFYSDPEGLACLLIGQD